MRKKINIVSLILCISIVFSGCSSAIPELTQEENAMITEYAAGLLLKYDKNSPSKLVDTSIVPEEELKLIEDALKAEEKASQVQTPNQTNEENTTDTTVIEKEPEKIEIEISKFLELASCDIHYKEYGIFDSYPTKDDEDYYLTFQASEGKQLVVFSFTLSNQSEVPLDIDLLNKNITARIEINNDTSYRTLTTLLLDDFTSYVGTVDSQGNKNLIMIIEVEKEKIEMITSSVLVLKFNNTSERIALF